MRVTVACFSLPVASPSFFAVSRVPCAGRLVPVRPHCVHVRSPPPILVSSRGRAHKSQRRREQTRCSNASCFGCAALRSCILREASVAFRACAWRSFIVTFVRSRCWHSSPLFAAPLFCVLCSLVVHFASHASKANALHASRKATSSSVAVPFASWCRQFAAACVLLLALMAAAISFSVLSVSAMSSCAAQLSSVLLLARGVELDVLSVSSFGDLPHAAPCRGHVGVARAGAVEHRVAGVLPSEKRAVRLRSAGFATTALVSLEPSTSVNAVACASVAIQTSRCPFPRRWR
ncbi:hypothetical protein ERJ75_000817400 [Trypanosoma vivax]|nr:hypothetical protein ERJ75_000817400 [Trypanosoma vivax]